MLRFNNRIEKRLSRVRLVDERGTVAAAPTGRADDEAAESLLAVVPPLAPGVWRGEWQGVFPRRPPGARRHPDLVGAPPTCRGLGGGAPRPELLPAIAGG